MESQGLSVICCLYFVVMSLGTSPALPKEKLTDIKLGYLANDGNIFDLGRQARIISGALTYAVKKVNDDPSTLPGYNLTFTWADNRGRSRYGVSALTDQWKKGAVGFIGPEDECDTEAKVAAAWNLPMIAYKCADHRVSDKNVYPTFARTFPPATQVAKSVIALLRHFKWHKFSVVAGSKADWQSIADTVEDWSKKFNMTVNSRSTYEEPYLPFPGNNPFPTIVQDTYIDTRVYLLLGSHHALISFMKAMETHQLLSAGLYIVVYVYHESYSHEDRPAHFFKSIVERKPSILEASRSLLVISGRQPSNPNYDEFHREVKKYNAEPPFKFKNSFADSELHVTDYAAYLYDAVMLYANAAHKVLAEGEDITNGTALMRHVFKKTYQSIQGFTTRIDENGDAEGNYTVLSRQIYHSDSTNHSMLSIGNFIATDYQDIPEFQYTRAIDWVGGNPPVDEPECGYRNERCIPPTSYTLEITSGVFGCIVLVIGVIGLILYRNHRYEQEIAGLLWKIKLEDIVRVANMSHTEVADELALGKRIDTLTTSMLRQWSYDSRFSISHCQPQMFTRSGTYKGQVVALKHMGRRGESGVTRDMQKEMKVMKDFRHENVCPFVGACVGNHHFIVVTEYCAKGSLQDILENEDIKLDNMFIASLVYDLIKGLQFLHESALCFHGNLKSSNCVVNSRWTLKITDYGFLEMRAKTHDQLHEAAYYRNLLWRAPELLRDPTEHGSPQGDTYAFGIILYEIIGRTRPFADMHLSPRDIIRKIKEVPSEGSEPLRPNIHRLQCNDYIRRCLKDCWSENRYLRPDFKEIRFRLRDMRAGMKTNIFDNMMIMMEKYQSNLESLVEERTDQLIEEKKKTEALLHRMLPKYVAEELKRGEPVIPETFSSVTIYFSDICGFTELSARSTPMQVVDMLNDLYTLFDSIIRHYDVYKVETIGDAYMVVSGLPLRNGDQHAGEIASMSLHLLSCIKTFEIRHMPNETIKLRIGMHSGSVVAAVVGLTMPRYCLFGDTVNTASRMESYGEQLKIHCSEQSKTILELLGGYKLERRGKIDIKGKGELVTYWLLDEDEKIRNRRVRLPSRQTSLLSASNGSASPVGRSLKARNDPWIPRPSSGPDETIAKSTSFLNLIRDDQTKSRETIPRYLENRSSIDKSVDRKYPYSSDPSVFKNNGLWVKDSLRKYSNLPLIVVDSDPGNVDETDCLLNTIENDSPEERSSTHHHNKLKILSRHCKKHDCEVWEAESVV